MSATADVLASSSRPELGHSAAFFGPSPIGADWKHSLRFAEHHGLIPWLYEILDDSVPPEGVAAIKARFEASARQSLWLTAELLRILDHLTSHGIACLPYKGPILAELLYGNVTRRQFSDLDILVHASDVARIPQVLKSLGYRIGVKLTPREQRAYLASAYEYTFDHERGTNLLEIQWRIVPRFYAIDFDTEAMFLRAAMVRLGDRLVPTLSFEDLLLVLCVHAAKHAWSQLGWLFDIGRLVRIQPIGWDFVKRQARTLGIEKIVTVTLCLAELGKPLPQEASRHFPIGRETRGVCDEILRRTNQQTEVGTQSLAYFQSLLQMRERRWDQLRFLQRLVWTPSLSEWHAIRLPSTLFPLYRAVRAVRLARRFLAGRNETSQ